MNTIIILTVTSVLAVTGLVAGCGDGTGSSESGGGSTASGSSSSSSSSSAGSCSGNEAEWKKATMEPIACEKNADCCVIVNGCTNAAQVVGVSKLSVAKANWPYCDDECTNCLAPAIAVECANKLCVGYEIPDAQMPSADLRKDHCGVDAPPLMMATPASSFACDD